MNASLSKNHLLHGPGYMMVGNLMFGLLPVVVRYITKLGIPPTEITFARFAIGTIAVVAVVAFGYSEIRSANWPLLALRGILGGTAVLCYFFAIQQTSAGKGVLLNYTHSMWANIYAVALLGAAPPRGFWWILGMAGIGLWLVINPDFDSFNWGDGLGLLSGMLGGGAILTIKRLRETDNPMTIFASFSVVGAAFALVPGALGVGYGGVADAGNWGGLFAGWENPIAVGWIALAALGVLGMGGQMFFTYAYRYTSVPLGTVMSLSVPAIAALGGLVFLHEPLTPHFLLGGTLIMSACGLLQLRERAARNGDKVTSGGD